MSETSRTFANTRCINISVLTNVNFFYKSWYFGTVRCHHTNWKCKLGSLLGTRGG